MIFSLIVTDALAWERQLAKRFQGGDGRDHNRAEIS